MIYNQYFTRTHTLNFFDHLWIPPAAAEQVQQRQSAMTSFGTQIEAKKSCMTRVNERRALLNSSAVSRRADNLRTAVWSLNN